MKSLNDRRRIVANNAWGHACAADHETFVIEESDIGIRRNHYLGYNHASCTFGRADIGRKISVSTDGTGWTCWSFCA